MDSNCNEQILTIGFRRSCCGVGVRWVVFQVVGDCTCIRLSNLTQKYLCVENILNLLLWILHIRTSQSHDSSSQRWPLIDFWSLFFHAFATISRQRNWWLIVRFFVEMNDSHNGNKSVWKQLSFRFAILGVVRVSNRTTHNVIMMSNKMYSILFISILCFLVNWTE